MNKLLIWFKIFTLASLTLFLSLLSASLIYAFGDALGWWVWS